MILMGTPCKLIGLSLSLCIKDIIAGRICESQVEHIVASTKWETGDQIEAGLESYARDYWWENPIDARQVFWRLFNVGKIDQPRVRRGAAPDLRHGRWVLSL